MTIVAGPPQHIDLPIFTSATQCRLHSHETIYIRISMYYVEGWIELSVKIHLHNLQLHILIFIIFVYT